MSGNNREGSKEKREATDYYGLTTTMANKAE